VLSGQPDTSSQYSTKNTINKYLTKNYLLVNDPTNQQITLFDNTEDPNDQNYVVHFKYQIEEINNSKKIRETINYIYDNGKEAAPSYTNSIQFVQSGEIDLVTNIRKLNDWTPSTSSFSAVKSPLINGYTADQKQIDQQFITPNSKDLIFNVVYTAEPVQPTKPVEATKPVQPTKPVQQPTNSTSLHKSSDKITQLTHQSYQNSKVSRQNTNNVSVQKKKLLSQTGTKTKDIGILGLALATASSLLGLISDKVNRKKRN